MNANPSSASDLIVGIARAAAQAPAILASIPKVYPAYIAFRCKDGLKAAMQTKEFSDGPIVAAVDDLETLGSAKYAFTSTDHNGTKYKITVEVLP